MNCTANFSVSCNSLIKLLGPSVLYFTSICISQTSPMGKFLKVRCETEEENSRPRPMDNSDKITDEEL